MSGFFWPAPLCKRSGTYRVMRVLSALFELAFKTFLIVSTGGAAMLCCFVLLTYFKPRCPLDHFPSPPTCQGESATPECAVCLDRYDEAARYGRILLLAFFAPAGAILVVKTLLASIPPAKSRTP